MSYSRRQLYALGEPLGDSVTRAEGGRIVYGDGGGGGGSQTQQTTQTTDLPDWAKPYAKNILAKGEALTDISQNPYQTYGGDRTADFGELQNTAMTGAKTMAPASQLGAATGLAGMAGMGALGTNYQAGRFSGGQFGNRAAEQYMNPYMQNVVDVQQREAQRQADIAGTQRGAQAVRSGAFGGSRQAITDAEAARNLALQKGDIQAQGSNAAFQQAQAQFNADQARRMQAQQLGEQSRQYGAGLGMQGLQTGLQAASTLGQLGGQQFQQGMDINKLQSAYGGMEQAQRQQDLDIAYQNFTNQQNYPYKQLGFMSDLLRGTPTGSSSVTQMYQPPGSSLGQLAGIGTGIYGLSKFMAEGGEVNSYADGGVTSEGNVENILAKLSDQQLAAAREAAMSRRDVGQLQMIEAELAERASMRNGLGAGITDQYADRLAEQYADGGIVAFADRGAVVDPDELTPEDYNLPTLSGIRDFLTPKAALENRQRYEKSVAEEKAKTTTAAKPPTTSTAGAGRGSYQGYNAASDIKLPAAKAEPKAKPSAELPAIPAGIKAAAAEKGYTSDDLLAEIKKAKEYFASESAEDLKGLQAMIDKQSGKSKEIKEQALGKALAEFGFAMAAGAAKPGARFLESAAGASPTLAASVKESQKLMQEADANDARMQMEYTKYKVALSKGDTAAATQFASNVRQLQMQQQQLELRKRELAQQGAYQQGSLAEAREGRKEKAQQFNQLLGVKGASAAAQSSQAQARLAGVRRQAIADFDNRNARKQAELVQQLGPIQGQYQYNQLRNQYINDVMQQNADSAAPVASGGARSVFDFLQE
jgi:hypothetical protein